jgi:hypothetical protein
MPAAKQIEKQKKPAKSPPVRASRGGKFKKGECGNPKGRPRGTFTKDIKALARQHTDKAVAALVDALKNKAERVSAAGLLLSYGWGKPQANTTLRVIHSIQDLSEEELLRIAGEDGDALMIEGSVAEDETE